MKLKEEQGGLGIVENYKIELNSYEKVTKTNVDAILYDGTNKQAILESIKEFNAELEVYPDEKNFIIKKKKIENDKVSFEDVEKKGLFLVIIDPVKHKKQEITIMQNEYMVVAKKFKTFTKDKFEENYTKCN